MAMMPPMLGPGMMPQGAPGMDPSMMGGGGMPGMLGPQFPSLDPNVMGQAMMPVMGMMQQDTQSLQQQQMALFLGLMEQMLSQGGQPNPQGFAAQTSPAPPVAPDMMSEDAPVI